MPLLIFLLALSVLATWWVYRDAATRGMNARLWALITLLTTMLSLPVYFLLRKPREA